MMNLLNFFLLLSIITTVAAVSDPGNSNTKETELLLSLPETQQEATSLRGIGRILADEKNLINTVTCDKFPRVCRPKRSSSGPDCCKKRCVNVMTDGLNCGMCGHKCKYPQVCCRGKCVNIMFDGKNCGGCHKKCKRGELCAYGMCNYA